MSHLGTPAAKGPAAAAGGVAASTSKPYQAGWAGGGAPADTSWHYLRDQQQVMLQQQDEALEDISIHIGRIKDTGLAMQEELGEQVGRPGGQHHACSTQCCELQLHRLNMDPTTRACSKQQTASSTGHVLSCSCAVPAGCQACVAAGPACARLSARQLLQVACRFCMSMLSVAAAACCLLPPPPLPGVTPLQDRLLGDLQSDADTSSMRLRGARARVQDVIQRARNNSQLLLIAFLTLVAIVLLILAVA